MAGQIAQGFEQAMDAVKGWFHLAALDKSAKLTSSLLTGSTAVPAGRVAHLNSAGEFDLGAGGTEMPIFLWNGSDHPDVYNSGVSPTTSTTHWTPISPTGVMSGLVATGAYELQTTEYETTGTYALNTVLTADRAVSTTNGKIVNTTIAASAVSICGVCSAHVGGDNQTTQTAGPTGTNAHGVSTLTFWPCYIPRSDTAGT
jgi:hypothetical protein